MAKKTKKFTNDGTGEPRKRRRSTVKSKMIEAKAYPEPEPSFPTVKAVEHYKRMSLKLKGANVRGRLAVLERNPETGKLVMTRVRVTTGDELKKLAESNAYHDSKVMESIPVDLLKWKKETQTRTVEGKGGKKVKESFDAFALGEPTDPLGQGALLGPNDEFHPILSGPYNKQLYLYDYLDMHSKCFEAKNHNPLAKQIVDVITFFTIGKGVRLDWKDANCQAMWNEWEKLNDFQKKIKVDSDTLTWAGEIMTRKVMDGKEPRIKQIDPSTIWEIVTLPEDIEQVLYYHQQFPTQWQLVYKSGDKVSEYIVNDIGPEEIFHVKINAVPGEKRGRSDLFPVLGWLKRLKDYYQAKVVKAQIEESFAMRKKVKGSDADVDALFNDDDLNRIPPPGSMIIENEAVETEYLTPTTSSSGNRDNTGESIKNLISTGVGLSPEYLGVSSMSNARATAMQHSEPAARKFESRQMIMEKYIRDLAEWVLDVYMKQNRIPIERDEPVNFAYLKGLLRARDWLGLLAGIKGVLTGATVKVPTDFGFEVTFPEISTDDRDTKIKNIQTGMVSKFISHERASEMYAREMSITSYDYDEEMESIQEDAANAAIQGATVMAPSQMAQPTKPKPGSQVDNANFKDGEE